VERATAAPIRKSGVGLADFDDRLEFDQFGVVLFGMVLAEEQLGT
jgi:hypothetical protein